MADNPQQPVDLGLEPDRMFAAMSYLAFLFVIPYFMARQNSFVNFHLRQGMALFALMVISIMAAFWISALGSFLFVITMLLDLMGFVQALNGRRWKLPIIGSALENFRI